MKPKIFLQQMRYLKDKCEMRQKPKNLVFISEDVEIAIDMLKNTHPTHPLLMSEDLCEMCKENKYGYSQKMMNSWTGTSKEQKAKDDL